MPPKEKSDMAAAVAKAPPYPKQKYNDAKFREIIPQLTLVEYLKIEYLAKGVWFKMLSKRVNMYNCECCGIDNVGPKPIMEHVRGKKHRFALQAAEKLFHPNYTGPKNSTAPARTPILDAYNGAAGTLSAKQGKLATDPPAQRQLTTVPKAATTPAQKTAAATAQKAVVQKKPATGPQQPKTAVKKPNESAPANAAAKTNTPANTAEDKPSAKNDSASKTNASAIKTTESSLAQPQVKDSAKPAESTADNMAIVILDDDDDDVAPAEPIKSAPPVVFSTPETAKPQRAPKRPITGPQQNTSTATNGSEANAVTPSKKVINPAAVLAKSTEKNLENMPRYQQNRVIIPTADKGKKKPSPVVKSQQGNSAPTFSTKTFSTSNDIEGIIGVEYVVKILKVYNDPEPFYECCLCEVVMDGIGMQTHLLGYNHRYKYIEKHFPTCFIQYKDHIGNIQVMGIIMDRIAKAIESHHGRELPYECLSGEFRSNRHGVMTTVYSFRHASEYSGPSFTNVVDTKQIDDFYKQKSVYLPPKPDPKRKPTFDTRVGSIETIKIDPKRKPTFEGRLGGPETKRSRLGRLGNNGSNGASSRRPYRDETETNIVDDAVHKQMVEEFLQKNRGRSRSPGNRRRRNRSRSRSGHRSNRRKEQRRSLSPLREGDIWQAYRHMVDRYKTELDQTYREYRKDPEKHPLYDEEWRKFWKHRKEQMSREGLDHRNYDFQPEWVRYFAVRIEELYDEQMEESKLTSRRRLFLPMTNDELEDSKYHVKVTVEPTPEIVELKAEPVYSQARDDKPSVVNVLRLLTALEDYLGSLGPRVVDLLSKALLVEKSNPRDINEIVLTLDNCTVLETAMEKLKGVLIAGLLEGPKVRAFNNVIFETEKILKVAYKMKPRNPLPVQPPQIVPAPRSQQDYQKSSWLSTGGSGGSFMPSPQSNSMVSGTVSSATSGAAATLLSQIDKKELASKLAAALTAQGKTDFNPEQLQQLIAVYSLIDKKKRDSAAAADKQKMTLSDTLTALLNPSDKGVSAAVTQPSSSGRFGGGNYSNSSNDRMTDRPGSLTNSSISNFVSMLNRDNSSSSGDSQLWQNLQNIQNSLRTQNAMGTSKNSGGFGGNSGGFMNNTSSVGNYNRGGYGGSESGNATGGGGGGGGGSGGSFNLGQNSSSNMNFNRGGLSSGGGTGFNSNFSGMNSGSSSGFSRGNGGGGGGDMLGNDDDMLGSGRGGGGMGSNFSSGGMGSGNSNFSRGSSGMGGGGGGNSGMGGRGDGGNSGMGGRGDGGNSGMGGRGDGGNSGMGGRGGNSGMGGGGSSGMGGGGGNSGMGGGGNSGFSRGGSDNFLSGGGKSGGNSSGFGGGFSGSSGLSNYSSLGGGNTNYQRSGGNGGSNTGMGMGGGNNSGLGMGGGDNNGLGMSGGGGNSNFLRSGALSKDDNNSMLSNFNKSFGLGQRNDGGNQGFGSNQRNTGGNQSNRNSNMSMGSNGNSSQNQGNNRGGGGSNWRNQ